VLTCGRKLRKRADRSVGTTVYGRKAAKMKRHATCCRRLLQETHEVANIQKLPDGLFAL